MNHIVNVGVGGKKCLNLRSMLETRIQTLLEANNARNSYSNSCIAHEQSLRY